MRCLGSLLREGRLTAGEGGGGKRVREVGRQGRTEGDMKMKFVYKKDGNTCNTGSVKKDGKKI